MMMVFGFSKARENTFFANVFPINYIKNKLRRSHGIRAIEHNSDHSSKSNSPVHKSVGRQPTITSLYALNNSMSPPRIVEELATSEDTTIGEENKPEHQSTQTLASMLGGHRIQYYDNNLLTSDAMIDVSLKLINTNQSGYESDAWVEKEKKVRFI